ncbi:MAG: CDP-glycerol glycerophosphotransferase family protein [Candidatus Bathyarchaeia archaeon]
MTKLVFAPEKAKIPESLKGAEVITQDQLRAYTPAGSVRRALEWVHKVAEAPVDGSSLLDLMWYDDVSLWWFANTLLFSSARGAVLTIEQVEGVLREKTPDEVIIKGLGETEGIIAQVCQRNAVKYTHPRKWFSTETYADNFKIAAGRLLIRMKEYRRRRLFKAQRKATSKTPRVLFLSPSINWRPVWNYDSSSWERRDVFMGRVMDVASKLGHELICVDVDYSLDGRVAVLREKLGSESRWVPFEQYLDRIALAELKGNPDFRKLARVFQTVSQSPAFKDGLQYHSIRLWDFLESRFRRLFSDIHLLNYAKILEGARRMVQVERPDALVMTYETGAYARASIVAAQEMGIPSLGIQHGFFTDESAEYMHTGTALTRSESGCPIPTRTAVGGTYAKDLLTRVSTYPESSVVVTGHPKHDDLVDLMKHESALSRGQMLSAVGLASSNKTIIVASGGFHLKYGWVQEYDKYLLETTLDVALKRNDTQLLLRLHPMEDGEMQRKAVEGRKGVQWAMVKGERNDLLWASDLFVTLNSATALDALILKKPVLMFEARQGEVPMVDMGNAVSRYTLKNLGEKLEAVLNDLPAAMVERSIVQAEIQRHANSVDGSASARVAKLLDELARNHGSRL